ncbi:MAG TPA: hypothetical protein VK157_14365, partial [Phycisphaerales bacterium]|nr:hypothetical protein [Phycisphaerales bacterium]
DPTNPRPTAQRGTATGAGSSERNSANRDMDAERGTGRKGIDSAVDAAFEEEQGTDNEARPGNDTRRDTTAR